MTIRSFRRFPGANTGLPGDTIMMIAGDYNNPLSNKALRLDNTFETISISPVGVYGLQDATWVVDHWVAIHDNNLSTSPDGRTWTHQFAIPGYHNSSGFSFEGLNGIWFTIVGDSLVYTTDDGGYTWLPASAGYTWPTPMANYAASVAGGQALVGGFNTADRLYYATEGSLPTYVPPGTAWPDFVALPNSIGYLYYHGGILYRTDQTSPHKIYSSVDLGLTWSQITTDLPPATAYSSKLFYSTVLNAWLLFDYAGKIWQSSNLANWTAMPNLPTGWPRITEYLGVLYATGFASGLLSWNGSAWAQAQAMTDCDSVGGPRI